MTSDQSAIEKRCIICGTSCAGQPRIKDATGKYAHKACAKQQAKVQPTIQPLDLSPEEEPEMAAFLDDLPSPSDQQPTSGIRAACPGCGSSINSDAMICVNCGCNTKTGRGIKTAKVKTKSKSNGPNLAAKAGSLAIAPFLPVVGAVIGGAIGAAVWAAIVHFTGFEIGYVAAGVGAVTGVGAAIGAGSTGNTWSGFVAVVVAIVAIISGKAIVNSIYMDQLEEIRSSMQLEVNTEITLDSYTDNDAIWDFADEMIWDHIDNDKKIHWPDPKITLEDAVWPEDYPRNIVLRATGKWEELDPEEQLEIRQAYIDDMKSFSTSFNDMITEEMNTNTSIIDTLTVFDALWFLIAIGAAWQVGSGGIGDD
tara:strand:+ start:160360 stop:161457 length:1098 start_codon:yes stop_codon:yes gene_type:complete